MIAPWKLAHLVTTALVFMSCSTPAEDPLPTTSDADMPSPSSVDMSASVERDMTLVKADMQRVDPPDMSVASRPDMRAPLPSPPPRPSAPFTQDALFIDVHMHCGEIAGGRCVKSEAWELIADAGGRGVGASVEHWSVTISPELLEESGLEIDVPLIEMNEAYQASLSGDQDKTFFVSLECWHDTPFGPDWAEACKEDARHWIERGASGFKDHAGKHWDSSGDLGMFASGWSARNGLCEGESLSDCATHPGVRYPVLEPAWREVIAYIVEELGAPVLTHATTWYGADSVCYDPLRQTERACAEMSREHLLDFAGWARAEIDARSRRRIIIAHAGFMVPGEKFIPRDADTEEEAATRAAARDALWAQLDELLSSGVSIDTAVTKDFGAMTYQDDGRGGCQMRELFARYPDQIVLGTDRLFDNANCLGPSYQIWEHLLTGPVTGLSERFDTCVGSFQVGGMDLDSPTLDGCPTVEDGVVDKVLKLNFLSMYEP